MNVSQNTIQGRLSRSAITCIAGLSLFFSTIHLATASDLNITARFTPNPQNTNSNMFENTTANAGYCVDYGGCPTGVFSITIPNTMAYMQMSKEQVFDFRVPYAWREVNVTNTDGTSATVKVRVRGLGAYYQLSSSVQTITGLSGILSAHGAIWNSRWINAPSGCDSSTYGVAYAAAYAYFWIFKSSNPCSKVSKVDLTPGVYFNNLTFMYELQTPKPLDMSAGTYTGQTTYTIGPTGDFQLGPNTANDPTLTLHFTLSVNHIFSFRFPAGADRLTLAPKGGWQQWLYNGPKYLPVKLLAHLDFQQWSSTKFKMQLQCQYTVADDCAIQNDTGTTQVPVKTMITLPSSLQDVSGQPVNRYVLSNSTEAVFHPIRYVNNERSTLDFEVDKSGVEQMVSSGSRTFRGNVTVVWDSDV